MFENPKLSHGMSFFANIFFAGYDAEYYFLIPFYVKYITTSFEMIL